MRTRRRGPGLDLAGARPYRPGDDVRRIDWRASARLSSQKDEDDFLVREHLTEQSTRVVVLVDRGPSMSLFPQGYPWLSKPAAIVEIASLIAASALQAGAAVSHLDGEGAESGGSIAQLLEQLAMQERPVPEGAFVFALSDFLDFPDDGAWEAALDRGRDVVPVVIQDPTWEQSFPDIAGALVPFADPATGRAMLVRLSRNDVCERCAEHEARFAWIQERFERLGLDAVIVGSAAPADVLTSFLDWAQGRQQGARLAR
jgi:uncharacterized protein (DUF58 family)